MAIPEKGAAIQGAAGLAKMLEIRCLILHSRNRLDLTYRKFLSKRNKKIQFSNFIPLHKINNHMPYLSQFAFNL